MLRYLRLLGLFWKSMLLYELEYRANFVINGLVGLAWAIWSFAGVSVFYLYRREIRDWNYNQALVVLGLFLFFNGLVSAVLRPNVERLTEHIRKGTLDFVLTKPVNSQFHATLRELSLPAIVDVLVGLAVSGYGLLALGVRPSAGQALLVGLLLVAAAVMLYSLVLFLATSAFWFVEVNNIIELLFTFYEAGRFPVTIYPQWLRILLTFVVPIAFITTVPAEVLLDRLSDPLMVVYALAMAVGLFTLSRLYWNFAVRRYSSASS